MTARTGLAATLILLSACDAAPPIPPAKSDPALDPIAFFTGATQGRGQIDTLFSSPVPLRVQSVGVPNASDSLVVTQRIEEGDKPARIRRWIIRPSGRGTYTGTLTDAEGPVRVSTEGNRAHIAYRMHNGLNVEQWLHLADDRRTIRNRMTVSKWGVQVAQVDERIAKPR